MDFKGEEWKAWTDLMVKVQKGDREAYARLLSEISPVIFSYVRRRVFNPEDVDDIYQDTLLTFHKALHAYQPDRPFSPWLFTILRNALWTSLNKRRGYREREVLLEDMPDTPSIPEREEGLDDRLHQALGALPPGSRQAVEMLKLKGMSVETAAKELGISRIALKVRAHRGYLQLRKILTGKN
ncbi:MAG TPA: sigma-70 family RNA polymerase sigma factor [bacterium]|nr:sigma-70 family RNA polymerase sigma factor [bacterium]